MIWFLIKIPIFFPISIRLNRSDFSTLYQIWYNWEYKLPYLLPDVKNILDIWANVWFASIFFHAIFKEARIYSFEPEKNNFCQLLKNCRKKERIKPFNIAVADKTQRLFLSNPNSYSCAYKFQTDYTPYDAVESKSIANIMFEMNLSQIDIVKIDVEWFEKYIFGNSDSSIWIKQTRLIIIELHDRLLEECSQSFFESIRCIKYRLELNWENIFIYNLDL